MTDPSAHPADPKRRLVALPPAASLHTQPAGGFWVAASIIVITLWTSAAGLPAVRRNVGVMMLIVSGNVSDTPGATPPS